MLVAIEAVLAPQGSVMLWSVWSSMGLILFFAGP
jgi:hypothetical protein